MSSLGFTLAAFAVLHVIGSLATFCPDIEPIEHGDIRTDDSQPYKDEAVLKFNCDRGFKGIGKGTITCKDGRWSDPVPYCSASWCRKDLKRVENGRKCRKSCKSNVDCKGTFKTCQCDGWCGKSCFNPGADCPVLSPPENGYILQNEISFGYTVTYGCNDGYVLTGRATRRCRADKTWSGYEPKCAAFSACGHPGDREETLNKGKVIEGKDAREGAWPWQALFLLNYEHNFAQIYEIENVFAGGSIIDDKWILTAAHVFDKFRSIDSNSSPQDYFLIAVGLTKLPEYGEVLPDYVNIYEPKRVYIHENYNAESFNYDVALVKIGKRLLRKGRKLIVDSNTTEQKFVFSRYVRPVCLPCMEEDQLVRVDILRNFDHSKCHSRARATLPTNVRAGQFVMVTGFGKKRSPGGHRLFRPKTLQEGLLKIADDRKCIDSVREIMNKDESARYTDTMLCASSITEDSRTDACEGDSGGPLVKQMEISKRIKYWILVGIVSWGWECGNDYPGFYTSVTSIMSWIWKVIDDSRMEVFDCRFESSNSPLCRYSNAGLVKWERISMDESRDILTTNVAVKRGAGEARMRSPTIDGNMTSCLKFYYYLETPLISNENVKVMLNNERISAIAPIGAYTPVRRWVGYQTSMVSRGNNTTFEIVVNGKTKIWIDDLEISNGECESHCAKSEHCENGGICVDEIGSNYYCSCRDQYGGSRCETGSCEYPPSVSSAFHNVSSKYFNVGTIVTYKCIDGYIQSGNPNITCLSHKTWSSAAFVCNKVSCGEPEKPANGYFEAPDYFFESWVTYHCDKGYHLEEPAKARRNCSATGTWSGKVATCQIRTCIPPIAPENGRAEARSRNFSDTVKYSCDQGYVLEGNAEGICDENSTWGVTPICKADINCRFENSSTPLCGYTNVGSVQWERILFAQNKDGLPTYSAVKKGAGEAIMRSPTVRDVIARCLKFYFYLETPLTSNENLRITLNNGTVTKIAPSGVSVPLGRWVGYQTSLLPTGKYATFEIVVVGKEKIWIDDLEVSSGACDSHCEESSPCENGGRCVDEIGSKYYCSCDDQYTGSRCQIEITCDRPSLANGRVTAPEKITLGTEVAFACDDGFQLKGVSLARCTRTGLSQLIPQCQLDDEGQCPRGFGYVLGSMCYRYLTTPRPYAEAEAICAVSGARLAVIQGQRVDKHLLENIYKSESYYWTGLRTDNSVPGWSSGDKFEGVGNPKLIDLTNIGRSNCAAYHLRWRWQWYWTIGFQNCRNQRRFICETWKKTASSYVVVTKALDSWLGIDGVYEPVPGLNTAYNKQAYRRDGQQPDVYLYFDYSQALRRYRWVIGEYEIKNDTAGLIQAIAYTDAATPDKIKEDEWMDTSRYSLSIDIKENNKWGEWSEWTCDVSCGRGPEKRRRTCYDLEPQSLACKGKDFEERVCDLDPCRDI